MRQGLRLMAASAFFLLPLPLICAISISSKTVSPGDVVLVSVSGSAADGLRFGKKTLPLFPYNDGTKKCFAGVPFDAQESIEVSCGEEKVRLKLTVTAAKTEKLSIPAKENIDEAKAAAEHDRILKAIATVSGRKLWSGKFGKPVPGAVKTPFGVNRIVNGLPGGGHRGVDLGGASGEPVKSAAAGRVLYCEKTIASGNSIALDHGQGVVSVYFHLSSFNVKAGDSVEKGQVIGAVGSTGFSTGPHLHWGAYVFGVCVDPFAFVRKDFFYGYGTR